MSISSLKQEMNDRRGTSVNLLKKEYDQRKKQKAKENFYGGSAGRGMHQLDFGNPGNKNLEADHIYGISVDEFYNNNPELEIAPVIVAVLDDGVDIYHRDFEGKLWMNEDEIPGNGIDDDQNGYVDDMHGWNFLGAETSA